MAHQNGLRGKCHTALRWTFHWQFSFPWGQLQSCEIFPQIEAVFTDSRYCHLNYSLLLGKYKKKTFIFWISNICTWYIFQMKKWWLCLCSFFSQPEIKPVLGSLSEIIIHRKESETCVYIILYVIWLFQSQLWLCLFLQRKVLLSQGHLDSGLGQDAFAKCSMPPEKVIWIFWASVSPSEKQKWFFPWAPHMLSVRD